jgi:hypothetical protein
LAERGMRMKKELDELKGVLNVINRLNDTSYITEGVKEELKKTYEMDTITLHLNYQCI